MMLLLSTLFSRRAAWINLREWATGFEFVGVAADPIVTLARISLRSSELRSFASFRDAPLGAGPE
jgi:hypothetical protein